jgi:hypothetical protein
MYNTYKEKVQKLHGTRELLQRQLRENQAELKQLNELETLQQRVLIMMQESEKEIQQQIILHISDVVDTALNSLFPNRYEFRIDFLTKNKSTFADIYMLEDGFRIPIRGGLADLTCVALRMAVWSLSKTDAVLLLDEPMLGIAAEARPLMAQLLKQLSSELGLQIILVSHTDELIDISDKVYKL